MKSLRPLRSLAAAAATALTAVAGFAAEKFDRAMIALRTSETSVYLGWRRQIETLGQALTAQHLLVAAAASSP